MNYRKLVRVAGSKKATPASNELINELKENAAGAMGVPLSMVEEPPTPQPVVVEKVIEKEVIDQETKDILMSIQDSLSNRTDSAPEWMNHTTLTDEECAEVQSFLMEVKENYFPDMELSPTIPKMFIWNIPRPVYEVFKYMVDRGETEELNPLFWFFTCCVDLTPEMFCNILKTSIDNFTTGEYKRMEAYIETDDESEEEDDYDDAEEVDPDDIDIDEYGDDTPLDDIDDDNDEDE